MAAGLVLFRVRGIRNEMAKLISQTVSLRFFPFEVAVVSSNLTYPVTPARATLFFDPHCVCYWTQSSVPRETRD